MVVNGDGSPNESPISRVLHCLRLQFDVIMKKMIKHLLWKIIEKKDIDHNFYTSKMINTVEPGFSKLFGKRKKFIIARLFTI